VKAMRGYFIAIEGIDGSGTTTQARELVAWLDGRPPGLPSAPAHMTCEPSAGPVGELLRQVLRGEQQLDAATVALLFAADRCDHVQREVEPRLAAGNHVVSDRYVFSSLAYQSLEHDLEWVKEINRHAGPAQLTVYLRVSPRLAAKRRGERGGPDELFDAELLQRQIAGRYDSLLGAGPTAGTWQPHADGWRRVGEPASAVKAPLEGDVAVLDGDGPPDQIQQQLRALVTAVLRQQAGGEP